MPTGYTFHHDRGFVATRFTGAVTDEEFIALYRRMLSDPEYVLGTNEIADLRDVTLVQVSANALRAVESLTRQKYRGSSVSFRTAVIAPHDVNYGIARMYGLYSEGGPEDLAVFRATHEALQWLGVVEVEVSELHRAG